jgi:pimeloyl-ACP methyl ester carboxylesterase
VSLWRQLADGVRALANRSAADRDVADQLQHYLDETTAAFVARGLSRDEARRAARLELGNLRVAQEDVRASGWENVVVSSLADLCQALRRLRRGWVELQRRLVQPVKSRTPGAGPNSGHGIPLESPDAVITAVREILTAVRDGLIRSRRVAIRSSSFRDVV